MAKLSLVFLRACFFLTDRYEVGDKNAKEKRVVFSNLDRTSSVNKRFICERFEPRSHFKRLSLIVRVNVVLNRTVVVDCDWRFDNLCGSHLQSQSELCHVSWWYYTLVIDLIGQKDNFFLRDQRGKLERAKRPGSEPKHRVRSILSACELSYF